MESQSSLQKELQKARHDAREAIEAKEKHAEEMAELSETVEMATLDKEMAEEKAEALQAKQKLISLLKSIVWVKEYSYFQLELETYKEKCEELQLDLELIKAEMADDPGAEGNNLGESGRATNFEMKQLQAQVELFKLSKAS